MVTILNKSNRPIGVAGQSVLPDKEIKVQDKLVYCAVFDEDGNNTGKKQLLPGLIALKEGGFINILEEKEEPKVQVKEEVAEEKPKAKKARKTTKE